MSWQIQTGPLAIPLVHSFVYGLCAAVVAKLSSPRCGLGPALPMTREDVSHDRSFDGCLSFSPSARQWHERKGKGRADGVGHIVDSLTSSSELLGSPPRTPILGAPEGDGANP